MYFQKKRFNKFGSKKTTFGGNIYHSKKEADYAMELELRVKAGELKEYKRQVPLELRVNGQKICTYTIDFVEVYPNGREVYTEIKGFATREWSLKWKLFDALYPDLEKQVIT